MFVIIVACFVLLIYFWLVAAFTRLCLVICINSYLSCIVCSLIYQPNHHKPSDYILSTIQRLSVDKKNEKKNDSSCDIVVCLIQYIVQ